MGRNVINFTNRFEVAVLKSNNNEHLTFSEKLVMSSPSTTTNTTVTAIIGAASTESDAGVFQISEELKEISTNTATAVIETATEEINPSGEDSDQIESTGENFGNFAATTG